MKNDRNALGSDFEPTDAEVERAGDALLDALLASVDFARAPYEPAQVGDLVVVTTAPTLDWERVGYLLTVPSDGRFELWSCAGRVVRWSNASCTRIGGRMHRLRSLPHPSQPQIEESRRTDPPTTKE